MSYALTYLRLALFKGSTLQFLRNLRRPTTFIGITAVLSLASFLWYVRAHHPISYRAGWAELGGAMLIMLGGSLFKGFQQRGMVFEPADLEFLFTSPFTQRQIIFYRLLPNYLFAIIQGLFFYMLFYPYLEHPILASICCMFFQMVCFHVATGAALFAGTISESLHHRLRWMLLGFYFAITALYLRAAVDIHLIPSCLSSRLAQFLFYPAATISEVGNAHFISRLALSLVQPGAMPLLGKMQSVFCLSGFAIAAVLSLGLLFKLKADVFEGSLAATTRVAEKRLRLQAGRRVSENVETEKESFRLPQLRIFRGAGAIVWKNLIVARRSKRELGVAFGFTAIYTLALVAIRWKLHSVMANGGDLDPGQLQQFDTSVLGMMTVLPFFLQRTVPFDFRCDGQHLVEFRKLPVSPFALALAEIVTPTIFCLVFQSLGIVSLMCLSGFNWWVLLQIPLILPAMAMAINGVWNLHYLLSATRRASGKEKSATAVGTIMIVALSFLIFLPAVKTGEILGKGVMNDRLGFPLAIAAALAVQYLINFLLVMVLAKLFQRFEVSPDSQ